MNSSSASPPPRKAIIIAAGLGSRLGDHTQQTPKCLLQIGERSILDHQLEALGANGVDEFIVIEGHASSRFEGRAHRTYVNDDYENNNVLLSLMYAADEMDEAFIASYSDILYTSQVVDALQASTGELRVVVDLDWRRTYEGRTLHPESEAEKAHLAADGTVLALGKGLPDTGERTGEFIGLMACSAEMAVTFRTRFEELRATHAGRPFGHAKIFEKSYLTDLINQLIEDGVPVEAATIHGGWMEIDTPQDLERARRWVSTDDFAQRRTSHA